MTTDCRLLAPVPSLALLFVSNGRPMERSQYGLWDVLSIVSLLQKFRYCRPLDGVTLLAMPSIEVVRLSRFILIVFSSSSLFFRICF